MRPPRVSVLSALLAAVSAVSCASVEQPGWQGPEAFVADHYLRLTVGADWNALRDDFHPEAQLVRHDQANPGALVHSGVEEFFDRTGPGIDGMQSFRITPLGMRATVYDRTASVIVYVQVESVDADGNSGGFTAVDQFSLARDAGDAWRITHLLYQREVEGWPPPHDVVSTPFTAGADPPRGRVGFGLALRN